MKLQLAFLAASAAICQGDVSVLKSVIKKMVRTRIRTRVTAVNNLHDAVLAADTTDFDKWPLCCDMEALTNIFHSNYGCAVDSTLACRRGPCTWGVKDTNRSADMPSTLGGKPACGNSVPGQAFYDACRKNMRLDYEGTSFQYWGAETGLFLEYPGSGIGKKQVSEPCSSDKYDCRKRGWYLESQQALRSTRQSSVQFSSPYFGGLNGKVLMATASRSVSTLEYFQGVVGMDIDIDYLMEPLADLDGVCYGITDSEAGYCMYYSFMIDGNNGEIMAHPKLREIPDFLETGKNVKYDEVEPEMEIQHAIADILGKEQGEFSIFLTRYRTFRNEIIESEEAESAAGFFFYYIKFFQSYTKENIEISCVNLETSGAALKYTVCAVFRSGNEQLHLVIPGVILYFLACYLFRQSPSTDSTSSESSNSGSESA